MEQVLDFLTSKSLSDLAADPRVLFGTGVVFVLAVLFRWKYVLLFLFAVGGTMAVSRYAGGGPAETIADRNLILFAGGTIVIAVVLIYFLFIRGD